MIQKIIAAGFSLLLICLASIGLFFEGVNAAAAEISCPSKLIIIDAGHGGFDGGAVSAEGTNEKDINLSIALKLDALLKSAGFETVLTRDGDYALCGENVSGTKKAADIKKRVEIASENPDGILVSIHLNSYPAEKYKGAQVFYKKGDEISETLAIMIQECLKECLDTSNHRQAKGDPGGIYILEHAPIPALIVECGFLSNATEAGLLKNDEYQTKVALSVLDGILKFYGENR